MHSQGGRSRRTLPPFFAVVNYGCAALVLF